MISYARVSVQPGHRCWLCGTTEGPLRSDVHLSGHLCPSCWTVQPRGYNAGVRAASALAVRLQLGGDWTGSGLRHEWLRVAAHRNGVTAWHDVPAGTPGPDGPFGWIAPGAVDQAAADLREREAAFDRSRVASGEAGR